MCFKMGKYFLEGNGYREAMKSIARTLCADDERIDLIFLWFNDNVMIEESMMPNDVCLKIDNICDKADELEQAVKDYCMEDYENVVKPEIEAELGEEDKVDIFDDLHFGGI